MMEFTIPLQITSLAGSCLSVAALTHGYPHVLIGRFNVTPRGSSRPRMPDHLTNISIWVKDFSVHFDNSELQCLVSSQGPFLLTLFHDSIPQGLEFPPTTDQDMCTPLIQPIFLYPYLTIDSHTCKPSANVSSVSTSYSSVNNKDTRSCAS